ncbi:MAG: bifunctional ADP-dependent NAD(P)H-hydrate dehydratase/NAD(P)H-hydrate epimerase, partial [Candidatus Omnitrophica bacterium]|nr:bifunctional ADP-dependent NAD(P)H-hydrate dehydratase/NAD(P)H-hydrate epimerase [Candidatus Omnitrophota bacterium]
MKIVTVREMCDMEEAVSVNGISKALLMENAGKEISAQLLKRYPGSLGKKRICIICGKGNNGGDGLVTARYLLKSGVAADILIFVKEKELSP